MYFVELLQAALHFRSATMNKEEVQRRMSAFRSARGVSSEAGWRGRSQWELGKNSRGPVLPIAMLAP